jgi:hypothetical protein
MQPIPFPDEYVTLFLTPDSLMIGKVMMIMAVQSYTLRTVCLPGQPNMLVNLHDGQTNIIFADIYHINKAYGLNVQ